MEALVRLSLAESPAKFGGVAVTPLDNGVKFTAPSALVDSSFPAPTKDFVQQNVPAPKAVEAMISEHADAAVAGLTSEQRNTVIFTYGQRYTPKRRQLFGTKSSPTSGVAHAILSQLAAKLDGTSTYCVTCFGIGSTDELVDFIDPTNPDGVLVELPQEGPKAQKLTVKRITSAADATAVSTAIATSVEAHFAVVSNPPTKPEDQAMPPYLGTAVFFALHRYASAEDVDAGRTANSIILLALGDSDRPVLCGVDPTQAAEYEAANRILCAVIGVVTAINCNRLRIPFGKTKTTTMLKRAYNAEKNMTKDNKPTTTIFWAHVLTDDGSAEEAYHTLCTVRRAASLMGGISVGSVNRDLAAEKWRVEQDIIELKDELSIAKAVHDYKPCIYEQAKPVPNVAEEVRKRVEAIKRKRQEARQKAEQEMEKRAAEEAQQYIAQLEKEAGKTIADLEAELKALQGAKTKIEMERIKRREEHDKHMAKIQKKRNEEEDLAESLAQQVEALEKELQAKRSQIATKQNQLDAASEDQAKGRTAILKEREEIRATRKALYDKRRKERVEWLKEIEAANERLLMQVNQLAEARVAAKNAGLEDPTDGEDTVETVKEDIQSINDYLPKLIALDDVPADPEAVEVIRRQLEEYFESELEDYTKKLDTEKKRLAELQEHVEGYKRKLTDAQSKQKRELLNDAQKKDNFMQAMGDRVIGYLQTGHRMYKVSSTGQVRYRFFYLTEDCKRMCSCELNNEGEALNRAKPTTTIVLRDVVKVILGTYGPSFVSFAGDLNMTATRPVAMRDDGCKSMDVTKMPTPASVGKYNYRAFVLELKSGKTVELVTEVDNDFEAWVTAFKRIFKYKTPYEKRNQPKAAVAAAAAAPPEEAEVKIVWGEPMNVKDRPGFAELGPEDQAFCAKNHVAPKHFLSIRQQIVSKSQTELITVCDVRNVSKYDILRAQLIYEHFIDMRVIPLPKQALGLTTAAS